MPTQLAIPETAEFLAPVNPMSVLQMAIQQGASIENLTKLMELQERWQANEARQAFNASMAQFKANPPQISKNKHVKFGTTEYDHATLDHVTEKLTQALSAVGISHKWAVEQKDGQIAVTCVLTHQMGHSENTTLSAGADSSGSKNSIQAIGSTVTYLQRYTLLAATGMAAGADNDGAGADKKEMPLDRFSYNMERIETADTAQDLLRRYKDAYKEADTYRDDAAKNQFIAAKDVRKEAIDAGN
jgi:hypothetical protein